MTAVVITADQALVPPADAGPDRARGPTAVLAIDGAIVRVGDPGDVAADPRAAAAHRIAWSGRAMVPGTVNTHNHSFQSLLRGIGDDLPFLTWRDQALYRYSPRLDADGMATAALFAFGEMLLHGVTTVCDFYYLNRGANDHASAPIEAARRLGIRIVLARCFYDWSGAPEAYRETVPQAVAHFEALERRYHDREQFLVSVQPAPHSQHGASPAMIEAGAGCARDAGVPWHIHLAEEQYQVDQSLERFGARPLHAIAALPVDLSQMIAVHGCWFDAGERAVLAERGGALAYCPGSNMFLGDGVTDLVDLVARGVRVGLGTDGGCSNNRACSTGCAPPPCSRRSTAPTARRSTPRPASRSARGPPVASSSCRSAGSRPDIAATSWRSTSTTRRSGRSRHWKRMWCIRCRLARLPTSW
ncbi:MAG: hypothetical protein E6J91_51860 [Deltaproteobacteria bacterium]|nr:MAG: hypothetical protein E6J91_51860 [Deltaproteobacteria bacterium]